MGLAGCGPASQTFNIMAPKDREKGECLLGVWSLPGMALSKPEVVLSRRHTLAGHVNLVNPLPRSSEFYKNVLTYEPLKKIDE